MSNKILNEINNIELHLKTKLPRSYKMFLIEEIHEMQTYELKRKNGDMVYLFKYDDILERNKTYKIQDIEPHLLLIGQDGDLGYFINLESYDEAIYSIDLGALGSLDMFNEAKNIYDLAL